MGLCVGPGGPRMGILIGICGLVIGIWTSVCSAVDCFVFPSGLWFSDGLGLVMGVASALIVHMCWCVQQ